MTLEAMPPFSNRGMNSSSKYPNIGAGDDGLAGALGLLERLPAVPAPQPPKSCPAASPFMAPALAFVLRMPLAALMFRCGPPSIHLQGGKAIAQR